MSETVMRISDKEREYVLQVLDTQFSASAGGGKTRRLEEKFAELFNVKYAISHVNGTAALHSALVASGVGPDDEVIVPPLTMASPSFAVLHAGGVPVFADVDPKMLTIDPVDIERRVTPRTKAIIAVALYGLAADMGAIMDIGRRYKLTVIEDDAQCFLGYYKGHVVGSIGHLASFSFQSSKHVTSGEGGMVITNSEELAEAVRRFGTLGYAAVGANPGAGKITKEVLQDPKYERHISIGWNYRMSELCAAVALAQVERIHELVEQRIKVAEMYAQAAYGCSWLVPQHVPEGYKHSYWTYVLRLEKEGEVNWHQFRDKYMELGGDGIYAAWRLTYLEPAFRMKNFCQGSASGAQVQKYQPGLCPVAESVQPRLFQFKTNYTDIRIAEQKAESLAKTITYFNGR